MLSANEGNGTGDAHFSPISEVGRIAFRAPPFWKADPELWFRQIESQFITAGIISDSTKYHCVVSAMATDVLAYVSDIVKNPPSQDMYATLKHRLISQFADSKDRRLKKLLSDLDLGDKKPSTLLQEMRTLADNNVSEDLLKYLWMQRLPSNAQYVLAVSDENLSRLALMADKLCELSQNSDTLTAVSTASTSASYSNLETQINDLAKRFDDFLSQAGRNRQRFSNDTSHSFSRTRSGSHSRFTPSDGLCWFHWKFKSKARKCISPCKYHTENE